MPTLFKVFGFPFSHLIIMEMSIHLYMVATRYTIL